MQNYHFRFIHNQIFNHWNTFHIHEYFTLAVEIKNIMKKLLLPFILLYTNTLLAFNITPTTQVSLITCGCGNEVYSVYGHTALRIKDTVQKTDVVINYGLFSMGSDDFLYKFVKGETDYMVGASNFESFIEEYDYDKRNVYENELNLSDSSKQALVSYIIWNLQPENREYRYKYFSDNCATRIRNLLERSANITWNTSKLKRNNLPGNSEFAPIVADYWKNNTQYTFRDMITIYQQKIPWIDYGIHFAMAAPSDKHLDYRAAMFIPDFLMEAVQNGTIRINGKIIPPAKPAKTLLVFKPTEPYKSLLLHPKFIVLITFFVLLVVSIWGYFRKKHYRIIDFILLLFNGLLGLLLFYLTFFSVHESLSPNYNLLWALPVNILMAFIVLFSKKIYTYYAYFIIVLYGLFFLCLAFLPQHFSFFQLVIPIIILVRFLKFSLSK